jgi:cysteinyl-tRNA synthetase
MNQSLQVYNTLTGKKEPFAPQDGKTVRIYACGPTVYDLSHLGHARMAITWDVIQRYLRFIGYNVIFVRNITDVDDKIIKRASELGMRPEQVARKFTFEFWRDMHSLNVAQPDFEPRATEYILHMIRFIEELIAGGFAYESGGDVYFNVSSFDEYGKLSKQNVDQLIVGSREQARSQSELAELKKSPVDFALWKRAPEGELGWQSPWGQGRPGWHTECSTMIRNVLGETIDIHGGGEDLVFPHHENEIAQSESLNKKPLARFWLHNSFVQVNAEKMSKSLGNFSTIQDLLSAFPADAIRLLILQTHYRNPIDFTPESLQAAKTASQRLVRAATQDAPEINGSDTRFESIDQFEAEFSEAMNNDFNTAIALSALFTLSDRVFQTDEPAEKAACIQALRKYAGVLGLTLEDTRKVLDNGTAQKIVNIMLELRKEARAKKDYSTSDLIRKELTSLGINVMDTTGGSTWERI